MNEDKDARPTKLDQPQYEYLGEAREMTRNGKATATEANKGKGR